MSKKQLNLLIRKLISFESEAMYRDTEEMGERARLILERSQMNHLLNLAYSCDKVVDIFDYIKNQTGKDSNRIGWAKDNFGQRLLNNLTVLKTTRDKLLNKLQEHGQAVDEFDRQKIYLELCREYIRHTVAQYLYGQEVQG